MRMLRIAAAVALLGLSSALLPAHAAAQGVSPEARQAADELFALLSKDMLGQMASQVAAQMWPLIERELSGKLDQGTLAALRGELERMQLAAFADVMKDAPDIYARHFTAEELRDLAAFYRTPTGRKALQVMPKVTADTIALIIPRIPEIQTRTRETFERILKERGYVK